MKRMMVISDLHCGHEVGLTHPGFDPDKKPKRKPELWKMRRAIWKWFAKEVAKLGTIDVLLVNGDAIDGKGQASGSTELLYPDRFDQIEMGVAAIRHIGAKKVVMSYGTPYHTGKLEDWEDAIASEVGAEKIGGEDTIDINGLLINYRHKVGRSSIEHGKHTAVAKERLTNLLWATRKEYPRADVCVRSHVHYFNYCGGSDWLAMTTPALQGYGTKFGARIATGVVDIGFVYFDIAGKNNYTWTEKLLRLPMQKPLSL
jgi:hypothetical protein